mmetsp:Transcript_8131/g.11715  ORF Transcript_8131/g.11715 Transcript_8131/m.11715 type:complete len:284 (-) Transcript_8131:37-888(-)
MKNFISMYAFGIISMMVSSTTSSFAFTPVNPSLKVRKTQQHLFMSSRQVATPQQEKKKASPKLSPKERARRINLLEGSKNGPFFKLDRFSGKVEFGATANLVTTLAGSNSQNLNEWIQDERRIAMSIWDKDLIREKPENVFELKVMTLQFVTIQLAPSVDIRMWSTTSSNSDEVPQFLMQSVSFDPNIQLLPGIGMSAKDLGIEIEVVGELQPTQDGKGVVGKIAYRSKGVLPPPMRLLPEGAIKAAGNTISDTVTKFAIQNFQKGARENFRQYLAEQQEKQS